jgi:hypothetical protein
MSYRPSNPNGQATMANSAPVVIASNQSAVPVSGTFWQGTQPISGTVTANIGTIAGLATETTLSAMNGKMAALGQAAMAASMPVVIASNQSAIPVSGTFWQATQPISAAALPLPAGAATEATLSAASAKLPATLGQKAMAASMAVALASDQSAIPASQSGTWNVGTVTTVTTVSTVTNLSQMGGQAIAMNTGVRSAGTQRVTIATDDLVPVSAASLPLPTGAATETTLAAANAKLPAALGQGNMAQSMRVVIASDQSNVGVQPAAASPAIPLWGHGVTGAAVPANAQLLGARGATANPTSVTNGQLVAPMTDKAGRLVVTNAHIRDLVASQQTNVAANTETTIVTAGGAGVFNDLVQLIITTAGAAAQTITIKDATGGTTRMILNYPNAAVAPGSPLVLNFDPPLRQAAAANNWTVTQSLATACNYCARFIQNI